MHKKEIAGEVFFFDRKGQKEIQLIFRSSELKNNNNNNKSADKKRRCVFSRENISGVEKFFFPENYFQLLFSKIFFSKENSGDQIIFFVPAAKKFEKNLQAFGSLFS